MYAGAKIEIKVADGQNRQRTYDLILRGVRVTIVLCINKC